MVNIDDSGLFTECIVQHSVQKPKSFIKDVSLYCINCEQWCVVHDDEVLDRHTGHDVDAFYTLHYGDRIRQRHWAVRVDVDRKEIYYWSLK